MGGFCYYTRVSLVRCLYTHHFFPIPDHLFSFSSNEKPTFIIHPLMHLQPSGVTVYFLS